MLKYLGTLLYLASTLYFAMIALCLYMGNFDLAFFILGAAGITGACLSYLINLNKKCLTQK